MKHYHLYIQEHEGDEREFCEAFNAVDLAEMGMEPGVPQKSSGYIYTVLDTGRTRECPFCQEAPND